jgi:hypothetical protein
LSEGFSTQNFPIVAFKVILSAISGLMMIMWSVLSADGTFFPFEGGTSALDWSIAPQFEQNFWETDAASISEPQFGHLIRPYPRIRFYILSKIRFHGGDTGAESRGRMDGSGDTGGILLRPSGRLPHRRKEIFGAASEAGIPQLHRHVGRDPAHIL